MPSVMFVINRALVRDPRRFGRRCRAVARDHGWEPVLAETSPGESGLGLAREAVAAGAGLVFAAGGDGTVRGGRGCRSSCVPASRWARAARS
jgi:diacylglycerol kinase (ATP)